MHESEAGTWRTDRPRRTLSPIEATTDKGRAGGRTARLRMTHLRQIVVCYTAWHPATFNALASWSVCGWLRSYIWNGRLVPAIRNYWARYSFVRLVPIALNAVTISSDDVSRKNLLELLAQSCSSVDVGEPSVLTWTV